MDVVVPAVTPRQAVATAVPATAGIGNIVDTHLTLVMGGYGEVFWI